jgi:hypothetical protein
VSEGTQNTENERMQVYMENLLVQDEDVREEDEFKAEALAVIIAIGRWIMQNQQFLSDVGEWWARQDHGVTNIKRWQNETDQDVEVWKLDGGSARRDHYRIPPGQTLNAYMWVPWANQPGTGHLRYGDHHAVIMVGGQPLAYFWQNGTLLRFNTNDAFVYGGVRVPGAAGAGGNRTMIIATDPQGRKGFALGTWKP